MFYIGEKEGRKANNITIREMLKIAIKTGHHFFDLIFVELLLLDLSSKHLLLEYNSNFKRRTSELSIKLLSNFKNYLNIKKIEFDTSEFESLDALNLAKIICVIPPLDYLTKQMLLEFNGSDELCENLISVLEIEINNFGKSSKIN